MAVTDPGRIIANGLDTISSTEIWNFLKEYMGRENVSIIVVGYPRQMNNDASESVQYIDPFLKKLKLRFPDISVETFDERFTSKMAMAAMIEGGVKKMARRNKALVDKISAVIILQSYLEFIEKKLI